MEGVKDMTVVTKEITFQSKGNCDMIDISSQVARSVGDSGINDGTVTLADPHGVRKKASIDNLVKSIDQHRKGDMLLGGFWLIE